MGAMKRAPASRGPPRGGGGIPGGGGGGGRTGVIPGGDGGAGSGGLPGGAGGRGMGGLPGDGKGYDEASARASRGGETYHGIEGATGGDGDGGLHRRGKGHAAEASGRPARGGVNEKGAGGRKIVDGGAGSGGIPGGSGVGGSHLHDWGKERAEIGVVLGGSNEDRGPFSGFLILCVDIEDETFEGYKQQIEALGGKAGTGFDYRAATHIAVEGEIQPGARAIWECDRKVVTTTSWIGSCFEKGRLLRNPPKDSSENLLPANMTPLATKKSTERSCISEGKVSKHRHGISRSSSIRRKLKFSPSGLYHQLLSCEEDRRQAESLYDYALGFRTYETRTLPGLEESFKLCKMSTKFLLGRCYNLMASLHKQKKSLGGVFSSRNFRIYTDDTVRLDILEAQLVLYSDTEGDKDYSSFVTMIKEEVFHGQPLPMDLVEWLSILSKGVLHCHQNVLSNFIYLMEPFQAFGAFVTMYLQFSSIQTTAGWADLFNALRDYDDWPHPRCYHMLKTLAHTDQNGYMVDYEDDIRGLMRLLWNCSKHRAKREVKSFIHMIMANYPRLLSDLQRALYQGGYLSHLTLKSHQ